MLFHEHANEGHKVEHYDTWHISYDHDDKEEADNEQKQK